MSGAGDTMTMEGSSSAQSVESGPEGDVTAAVATSTDPTERPGANQPVEPMIVKTASGLSNDAEAPVMKRANSAPTSLEDSDSHPLPPQANAEGGLKLLTVKERTISMSSVALTQHAAGAPIPSAAPNQQDFDEFINSPRGQNVIVERSPGGRYVRFMEKLGSGATKDVYRAYDTTEGIEVAWNVVNLAGVPKAERNRIVNEVRLLERLHHHNIISFHGSWVNREKQEVNFVTEILSSGTLKNFINKVQVIRWKIAKRWATQILNGLAYLHSQDPPVIHRDLKCDNIFINGTSGDLRIGDLGLSTVHRHGKVLSVLGTPEFMAPDLYEEAAYDEKVDIYAFGMCLLEIFTKEIPYKECNNPAQIYKKVMGGIPPRSLGRLRSEEARDFILLCLGQKNEETNTYVRPSASELLKHPFLAKGVDDDSEVEVDPPLQERVITEEPTSGVRSGGDQTSDLGSTGSVESVSAVASPHAAALARKQSRYSHSEFSVDEADQFEEMPDSEVNIRKVKVMMGRGHELEEEDNMSTLQDTVRSLDSTGIPLQESMRSVDSLTSTEQVATSQMIAISAPVGDATEGRSDDSRGSQTPPDQQSKFCVAAAVIQDESPHVRPYDDDILKLIIRLPVDGQTQNVQFDFHLVEDDPVQVAKEMVAELGIQKDAVLDISETVSGLARNARMKQEKHVQRQKWQQEQMHAQQQQQSGTLMNQQPQQPQQQFSQPVNPGMQQQMDPVAQQPPPPPVQQQQQQQRQPAASISQHQMQQHQFAQPGNPGIQQTMQGMQQAQAGQQQLPISHPLSHSLPSNEAIQQQQQHQPARMVQHAPQHPQQISQGGQHGDMYQTQQQLQPGVPLQQPQPSASQPASQGMPPAGFAQGQQPQMQQVGQGQQPPAVATAQPRPQQQTESGVPIPQQQSIQPTNHGHGPMHAIHPNQGQVQLQPPHAESNGDRSRQIQGPMQYPAPLTSQQQYQGTSLGAPEYQSVPGPTAAQDQNGPQAGPEDTPGHQMYAFGQVPPLHPSKATAAAGNASTPSLHGSLSSLADSRRTSQSLSSSSLREDLLESDGDTDDLSGDDDRSDEGSEVGEELRRLDEDFQKNLLRAQKVFDSRMDNLHRSKEEKEAQHLKTLEKHEKEKVEFEKRVKQAEKEQSRRIEQLQKEWDRKREDLAKHKKKPGEQSNSTPASPTVEKRLASSKSPPPMHPLATDPVESEVVPQEDYQTGAPPR